MTLPPDSSVTLGPLGDADGPAVIDGRTDAARPVDARVAGRLSTGAHSASASAQRQLIHVLGAPIDVVSSAEAVGRISDWATRRESRYVCITNVHAVVTSRRDPEFHAVLEAADMVTPDGAPVAWMMRRLGIQRQRRVCGPDLMAAYAAHAEATGQSIFFYGNSEATLDKLRSAFNQHWPGCTIAGAIAPPFRSLSAAEDDEVVRQINASGAGTVWVSLGCPKQERWMAAHRHRIHAVMIGVGAAFDFHAGTVPRAPQWMRTSGLEWLFRLALEPRRLGRRYLDTNTAFLVGAVRQLLRG